jgi:hypothetical protein
LGLRKAPKDDPALIAGLRFHVHGGQPDSVFWCLTSSNRLLSAIVRSEPVMGSPQRDPGSPFLPNPFGLPWRSSFSTQERCPSWGAFWRPAELRAYHRPWSCTCFSEAKTQYGKYKIKM